MSARRQLVRAQGAHGAVEAADVAGPARGALTGSVLVNMVKYPPVTSISREFLIKWKKKREQYEDDLRKECLRHGTRFEQMLTPVKMSFEPPGKLAFIVTTMWGIATTLDDVTDEAIMAKIDEIVGKPTNEGRPNPHGAFDNLKWDMHEKDVQERVTNFFWRASEIVKERSLAELLENKKQRRGIFRSMVAAIKPLQLKDQIVLALSQEMDTTSDFAFKDLVALVMKMALEQQKYHDQYAEKRGRLEEDVGSAAKRQKSGRDDGTDGKAPAKTWPKGEKWQKKNPKWGQGWSKDSSNGRKGDGDNPGGPMTLTVADLPDGCWICGGNHAMKNHKGATSAQKKEALAKWLPLFRLKKQQEGPRDKAQVMKTTDEQYVKPLRLLLNKALAVPCIADTGSNRNILPRHHLLELQAKCPDLNVRPLGRGGEEARGVGDVHVLLTHVVDLELQLDTAAGSVVVPGWHSCYVVDGGDEFILSQQILHLLGIDVERQLEQLAAQPWDDGDDLEPVDHDVLEPPLVARVLADGSAATDDALDRDDVVAVAEMIARAIADGFPVERKLDLTRVVGKYKGWRATFRSTDGPANVPPMNIRMKPTASTYKCKARKLNPLESRFLKVFASTLLRAGVIEKNNNSRYCSAAHPILKAEGKKLLKRVDQWSDDELLQFFRLTIDYRGVNDRTEASAGFMPFQVTALESVKDAIVLATFDLIKGFWQLPVTKESGEILSFMVGDDVVTPTRVMQGHVESALYFQSIMRECLAETGLLAKNLLVWIDDILMYAKSVDEYLDVLERFLSKMDEKNLKLNPKKCTLFKTSIKWCGRIIDGHGVRHDPERIEAISSIPYPKTAGQLQQYLCATNWLRESIVEYAQSVGMLQKRLDSAMQNKGRKKRVADKIDIVLTVDEKAEWDALRVKIKNAMELAHPDDTAVMCLFTDASNDGWSIVITQIKAVVPSLAITDQSHEMIACQSGRFDTTQSGWSIIEKEAYPIARACLRLNYILQRPQGFRMYCDHRNLIHVFAPSGEWKSHTRGKLMRWAAAIRDYRYDIYHVEGASNLWADLLSRWGGTVIRPKIDQARRSTPPPGAGAASESTTNSTACVAVVQTRRRGQKRRWSKPRPTMSSSHQTQPALRPMDADGFVWPTIHELVALQGKAQVPPRAARDDVGDVWRIEGRLWVPPCESAQGLLQRLLVVAHCGSMGHRGRTPMLLHLRRLFWIDRLEHHVDQFLRRCLLCKHVKGGRVIQRPASQLWHATKVNEGIHFDYLFLGAALGGNTYCLVLKDDLSHFAELVACERADASNVVKALLAWASRFGMPRVWISDQGSHFKNEVMSAMAQHLKVDHEFVVAYSPWRNGTVERLNRDLLQVMRVLLREYRLADHQWDYLLPVVQANLNQTPVATLHGKCPMEVFTGHAPTTALDVVVRVGDNELLALNDSTNRTAFVDGMAGVHQRMLDLHKAIGDERERKQRREEARRRHHEPFIAHIGDFVLWSRVDEKRYPKLLVTWLGPYRITNITEFSCEIEHIVTKAKRVAHTSRLKIYADSDFEITQEIREHVSEQAVLLKIRQVQEARYNKNSKLWEVLCLWEGLEDIEASWERFNSIASEAPAVATAFVDSMPKGSAKTALQQVLRDQE